ncbi:hypothetical protein F5Y09DRAFT_343002 [Xylaria sp. FL1042]|nr:hypothetical protein F5Y09DRAFT_343002 [Xylaria sp. FL1042]
MPYQSRTPLFNSIIQAAPLAGSNSHFFSTSSTRNLPSSTATPRGRASLAAAVVVGCVIDYELWTLYGAKYFGGKGEE